MKIAVMNSRIKRKKAKHLSRSTGGNTLVFLLLVVLGSFMALPVVYSIVQSFKPMEEIFIFPPRFTVQNPTIKNFKLIGQLAGSLWVPFSRYLFNSIFVSFVGTLGNVIISSMAAYPLAKHDFPGKKTLFKLVTISLLFTGGVIELPRYIVMAKLHIINTYWALILPVIASSMGLFLMKQFMEQVNDSLLEAARIDGMGEVKIFFKIVMPLVKPAWLTQIIFAFQGVWSMTGGNYIYKEELKLFPTALSQIQSGGIARAGVAAAAALIMLIPPAIMFLITQSSIMETMAHAGIKE
ncbi:MAG: carbohydrate ABC transporter permease [Lachnospiraceae bacterium]|nr:carbohydrate ABC transporter permease [Lachnospiraceae bacterium]MCM1231974.1 carbohydrate ABC transporter permease [Ruminococcus flavefaciens]